MVLDEIIHISVHLARDVDVVRARRAALRLAEAQNWDDAEQARVDLIVAELATNVLRHAGRGRLTIMMAPVAGAPLSIVCTDSGPGIASRRRDGGTRSSTGLGLGLAVVHELADDVEIKSTEQGTWIRATVTRRSK